MSPVKTSIKHKGYESNLEHQNLGLLYWLVIMSGVVKKKEDFLFYIVLIIIIDEKVNSQEP